MAIYCVYIINKAGGLIFQHDFNISRSEIEKTLSYPLDIVFKVFDDRIVVAFGERDGIKVGDSVLSINGIPSEGRSLKDGRDILETFATQENYPISVKFGQPKLSANEKIMLASMFHSLFAIGCQLSPEPGSSGIEVLETDNFILHCHQALTGIKFVVITDTKHIAVDGLMRKIHELYSDFALKNPFYSLDMPIRCDLFDVHLKIAVEHANRLGLSSA